jgi:hypothetical protein
MVEFCEQKTRKQNKFQTLGICTGLKEHLTLWIDLTTRSNTEEVESSNTGKEVK